MNCKKKKRERSNLLSCSFENRIAVFGFVIEISNAPRRGKMIYGAIKYFKKKK